MHAWLRRDSQRERRGAFLRGPGHRELLRLAIKEHRATIRWCPAQQVQHERKAEPPVVGARFTGYRLELKAIDINRRHHALLLLVGGVLLGLGADGVVDARVPPRA